MLNLYDLIIESKTIIGRQICRSSVARSDNGHYAPTTASKMFFLLETSADDARFSQNPACDLFERRAA